MEEHWFWQAHFGLFWLGRKAEGTFHSPFSIPVVLLSESKLGYDACTIMNWSTGGDSGVFYLFLSNLISCVAVHPCCREVQVKQNATTVFCPW